MYDPSTVAFDIKYPWKSKPTQHWPNGYRNTFITIWHKDPEKDGSDDSCGWFKRSRHGDKDILDKIIKDFTFEWQYWFDDVSGSPKFSVMSIVLDMFKRAALVYYNYNWTKANKFINKNLSKILMFAENPVDSMHPNITQLYGTQSKEYRIEDAADILYGWILRTEQKWYQHPRWHIHHWSFQIHPIQHFKRYWLDRCCVCNGRFKNQSAHGNWNSDKIWHEQCDYSVISRS